jgi:hypothetical protein
MRVHSEVAAADSPERASGVALENGPDVQAAEALLLAMETHRDGTQQIEGRPIGGGEEICNGPTINNGALATGHSRLHAVEHSDV